MPNHSSPSTKRTSRPVVRGEPSLRRVARTWWVWAANRSSTPLASPGSAAAKDRQLTPSPDLVFVPSLFVPFVPFVPVPFVPVPSVSVLPVFVLMG